MNELSNNMSCKMVNFSSAAFCDEKDSPTCKNGSLDFQPMLTLYQQSNGDQGGLGWYWWAIIIVLVIALIGGVFFIFKQKESKEKKENIEKLLN